MHIEVKKLEKSEIEISGTIDAVAFMAYWSKGFAKVRDMVELDGFRKGHAPENMIVAKFGDMIILEEMANIALRDIYAQAMKDHKFFPISEPKVTIKKLAKDNPLEVSLVVAVLPEITLPDYKKLSLEVRKTEDTVPTEEELSNVLAELQKGKAQSHSHIENKEEVKVESHKEHDHAEGEEHTHDEKKDDITKELTLPALDDEFAQSFGDTFKTLEELKDKIRENLGLEKKQKLEEKNRQAVMETLIKETAVEIPEVLLQEELGRMIAQMKADITKFGGTWGEYLEHVKKTEDEITHEWRDDAHKRVVSQLVLAKIAEVEKLHATEDEIEVELIRLLAEVQDADPVRAKEYLKQVLSNEKVLRFLTGKSA